MEAIFVGTLDGVFTAAPIEISKEETVCGFRRCPNSSRARIAR